MVWISSRESEDLALYSRRGCDPSLTASRTHIVKACSYHECLAAILRKRPSGTTLAPSPLHPSGKSISSTEDFHARTLARRDLGAAWQASGAAWFARYSGLSKKRAPSGSSWKMFPLSDLAAPMWSPKRWPVSGMTVGGIVYPLSTWERRTYVSGGSSLPEGLFPTATATAYGTGGNGIRAGTQKQVLSLHTMARRGLWPTPNATDYKGPSTRSPGKERPPCDDDLPTRIGGPLNPTWVEWLMGYPSGWTVCADWATPSCPPKLKKRSVA